MTDTEWRKATVIERIKEFTEFKVEEKDIEEVIKTVEAKDLIEIDDILEVIEDYMITKEIKKMKRELL